MKKRRIKSSPGSASYSPKNPICNRNRSSPSTSNRVEISKYFNKKMENAPVEVVESPYKNLVTEPVRTLNNSLEEENDFKTPKCYKQSKFKKEISNKSKKTRQKKSNIIRRQRKLTSMLEDNFAYSDVNHEHLHLALALSKSEQPNDEPEDDIEITCSYSTAQHTLEQFGFKSTKTVIRNGKPPKKSKKSKYQFITPILYIRTEEDRQNLISSKISAILSQNIQSEYNYDRDGVKIKSSYLKKFIHEDSRIFRLSNIDCDKLNNDMFYSESLNIERSRLKCGHFLKDWGKIAGRDRTPPRPIVNYKSEVKSEIKNLSGSLSPDLFSSDDEDDNEEIKRSIDKNLQSSFKMIDDIRNIESLRNSECTCDENKDKIANQTLTVRGSDDDVIEVNDDSMDEIEFDKESLHEHNENKIKTKNDKLSDSKNNLDDVSEENRMDTTDNILAGLEITSIESVRRSIGAKKNLDILSASLLSNFNSFNKTNNSKIHQKDNSDDSDCNITIQNLNGIEHFENFYDADNELNFNITTDSKAVDYLGKFDFNREDKCNKQLSTREEIYDLTQSDEDSDKDHDVNRRYKGRDSFDYIDNVQRGANNGNKINTKYEILSDSDDNLNDCVKRNGSVRKSLSFAEVSNRKKPSGFTKYSSFDTTSPLKLNLNDFCVLGEGDSEFDNPEIKGLFEKSIIINTEEKRTKSLRKSLSFTPISNIKNRENFIKHASFSTPISSKLSPGGGRLDKINSISSENLDYINDEELNYSSLRSTPYRSIVRSQVNDGNNITEENNLNTYSYLEKYYDEQFFNDGDNYEQSPITHPSILELTCNDKTPTSLCKNDTASTPDGYVVVKTRNITPMPDYDNMNTPKLTKELQKVGVKQLKRHRSIQILKHIYETTHPLCSNTDDEGENIKRRKITNELEVTDGTGKELVEIIGDITEKDDLIFERTQSKKIHSCRLPLHIAWHNLLSANPELKRNILLYEPLQLEVLYAMLKDQGYKYHLQDLLTFLDKKCITIRTNQNNRQSRKRF